MFMKKMKNDEDEEASEEGNAGVDDEDEGQGMKKTEKMDKVKIGKIERIGEDSDEEKYGQARPEKMDNNTRITEETTTNSGTPTPRLQNVDLKDDPVKKSKVRELTLKFSVPPPDTNPSPPPLTLTSGAALSHLMGRRPRKNITGTGTSADLGGNNTIRKL